MVSVEYLDFVYRRIDNICNNEMFVILFTRSYTKYRITLNYIWIHITIIFSQDYISV